MLVCKEFGLLAGTPGIIRRESPREFVFSQPCAVSRCVPSIRAEADYWTKTRERVSLP